jgi:hypothetical protein
MAFFDVGRLSLSSARLLVEDDSTDPSAEGDADPESNLAPPPSRARRCPRGRS